MLFRVTKIAILVVSLLLITLTGTGQRRPQSPANRDTLLFVVEKYDGGEVIIEPVTILRGNRYLPPPSGEEGDSSSDKFAKQYYASGTRYRMLFGGGEAGFATVKQRLEPGCVDLQASVTTNTLAPIGGEVNALATNADALGHKDNARRAPEEDERSAILKIAQTTYRQKGIPAALVKNIKVVNITALDINRDGLFEIIGAFRIEKGESTYSLLVIAEPEGLNYKSAFSWYKKAIDEGSYEVQQLVDAIDLDRDGVMEIVVRHSYYESHDFVIYKKQKGRWSNVYRGGGGGC